MVITRTRCEVECLCWGRVLVGVGWFIAVGSSQGDRALSFPTLKFPPPHKAGGPRVGTEFALFEKCWVQVGWREDAGGGRMQVK